jgi:LysM repeat protein
MFTLQMIESRPDGLFTRLRLSAGELWIILTEGELNVETPSGLAAVRGSFMHVTVEPATGAAMTDCLEGDCAFNNNGGAVPLVAGQNAFASDANTSPQRGRMNAADVARWTSVNPEAENVLPDLTETVRALEMSETPLASATPTTTFPPTITFTPSPSATATVCPPLPEGWVTMVVQEGDTLESLAEVFGIEARQLALGNCFPLSKQLTAGDILFVPPNMAATKTFTPTASTCGAPAGWVTYTVQTGDSLIGLAKATGTSVAEIQYANCLEDETNILVGQRLKLPQSPDEATPVNSYTPAVVSATPTNTPTPTPTDKEPVSTATQTQTATSTSTTQLLNIVVDSNGISPPTNSELSCAQNLVYVNNVHVTAVSTEISYVKLKYKIDGSNWFYDNDNMTKVSGGPTDAGGWEGNYQGIITIDSANAYIPLNGSFLASIISRPLAAEHTVELWIEAEDVDGTFVEVKASTYKIPDCP